MAASGWPVAIAVFGYRGVVRVVVPKFSKVQPCAAAAGLRSANMRRLPPASVNRAVTAFIHISKEPRRRLAQPNNVGQRFLDRQSVEKGRRGSVRVDPGGGRVI